MQKLNFNRNSSTCRSLHSSMCRSLHSSTCRSLHSSTCISLHSSTFISLHSSTCISLYSSMCIYLHSSMCISLYGNKCRSWNFEILWLSLVLHSVVLNRHLHIATTLHYKLVQTCQLQPPNIISQCSILQPPYIGSQSRHAL